MRATPTVAVFSLLLVAVLAEDQGSRQNSTAGVRTPCNPNPCFNGAGCTERGVWPICSCRTGFTGYWCEDRVSAVQGSCDPNPCYEGATCSLRHEGYVCACPASRTGPRCDQSLYCSPNPCQNGGTCGPDGATSYRCECPALTNGQWCETTLTTTTPTGLQIGACRQNHCTNGGTCISYQNYTTCRCPPGYKGRRCELMNAPRVNQCSRIRCENGATCIMYGNYTSCRCAPGYMGLRCETRDANSVNRTRAEKSLDEIFKQSNRDGTNSTYDMDMILNDQQQQYIKDFKEGKFEQSAPINQQFRWPGGIIPYEIDTGFTVFHINLIRQAMNEWETNSCVRFVRRTNQFNFIRLNNGLNCRAPVGHQNIGQQNAFLSTSTCFTYSSVLHELGHIIGRFHEHGRPDRDTFVEIQLQNVAVGDWPEFDRYPWGLVTDYDVPYDYLSIMHYAGRSFSRNGAYTIVTLDEDAQTLIGRATSLSPRDIETVNLMYQCPGDECLDRYDDCVFWTQDGQCSNPTSRPWMEANCRLSCGLCFASRCPPGYCGLYGVCQQGANNYRCVCNDGYIGPQCGIDVCADNACNGGACIRLPGEFRCDCPPGFSGHRCQTAQCGPGNACGTGACERIGGGGYQCRCLDGSVALSCPGGGGGPGPRPGPGPAPGPRPGPGPAPGPGPGGITQRSPCFPSPCHGGKCEHVTQGIPSCYDCPNNQLGTNCEINPGNCGVTVDACYGEPCQQVQSGYRCRCGRGRSGSRCQFVSCNVDVCNGGVCSSLAGNSICECPPGRTGQYCNRDACNPSPCGSLICVPAFAPPGYTCQSGATAGYNPCIPNPCNSGSCRSLGTAGYICTCPSGQIGRNCDIVAGSCNPNPCNGAACALVTGGRRCQCPPQRFGLSCELSQCDPRNCNDAGTCVSRASGGFYCDCQPGRSGVRCEISTVLPSSCFPNPCLNGAVCQALVFGIQCNCLIGFSGLRCEVGTRDCTPNPCENSGRCVQTVNGYRCECQAGNSGQRCQNGHIFSCNPNPCRNFGRCVRYPDRFSCVCNRGYTGLRCDEFSSCTDASCSNGRCALTPAGYVCDCNRGYTGPRCLSYVTPSCAVNPCRNAGRCVPSNTASGYICSCPSGFHGVNCESVRCVPNPCNGGICTLFLNAYQCTCPGGVWGNQCQYGGSCVPQPCRNGGVCRENPNGYQCDCPIGYSGISCQYGACDPNPCNSGVCTTSFGTYFCQCPPGTTGRDCQFSIGPQLCAPNPCGRGQCVPALNGYTCMCPTGYTGFNCENAPSGCQPGTCVNGATCISIRGGRYTCFCPSGYTGLRCENIISTPCTPNPCSNGGTCVQRQGRRVCQCPAGYSGDTCAISPLPPPSACSDNPCTNGGSCIATATGVRCICLRGFIGDRCRETVDTCDGSPCLNGGLCTTIANGYICTCRGDYSGDRCQNPGGGNPCLPNPCNGYRCNAEGRGYVCDCPAGTVPPNCRSGPCQPNPCNSGTCTVAGSEYICNCPDGTSPPTCLPTGTGACVNFESEGFCQQRVRERSCERYPNPVLLQCPLACRICGPDELCRDFARTTPSCAVRRNRNECHTNFLYMSRHCRRSCALCI